MDESESHGVEPCIFVVAGWMADAAAWRGFEGLWKQELDRMAVREFHSADCFWGKREYTGIPDSERTAHRWRLIDLLKSPRVFGVSTALTLDESGGPVMKRRDYAFGLMECMASMTAALSTYPDEEQLRFVVDQRAKHARELHTVHGMLVSEPDIGGRVGAPAFGDSASIIPLQAADLLAHEMYLQRRYDIELRPSRAEFAALDRKVFRRTLHWDQANRRLHDYDFPDDE